MTDTAFLRSKLTKLLNETANKLSEDYKENYLKPVTPVKTGALQSSWTVVKNTGKVSVVTDKDYAIYLEFGTANIAPRAFIRQSFAEFKNKNK